jgi:hypothetical protein
MPSAMSADKDPSFGQLVLRRARRNTFDFFKSWMRDSVTGAITLAIATGLFFLFGQKSDPLLDQVVTFLIGTVATGAVILCFIFLWNLALAPEELIYELQAIETPEKSKKFARVPPSYDIWKIRDIYTVDEFAALLDEHEPNWSARSHRARSFIDLLKEQIEKKKLPAIREVKERYGEKYTLPVTENTKLQKSEAISWAEKNGFDVSELK